MPHPDVTEAEFNTTFDRYWLPVFRFALAWTNDWAAAEDLTQDAFMRLWAKRSELDWSEPLLPWLLTATRRLATDRFRRLRTAMRFDRPAADARPSRLRCPHPLAGSSAPGWPI